MFGALEITPPGFISVSSRLFLSLLNVIAPVLSLICGGCCFLFLLFFFSTVTKALFFWFSGLTCSSTEVEWPTPSEQHCVRPLEPIPLAEERKQLHVRRWCTEKDPYFIIQRGITRMIYWWFTLVVHSGMSKHCKNRIECWHQETEA